MNNLSDDSRLEYFSNGVTARVVMPLDSRCFEKLPKAEFLNFLAFLFMSVKLKEEGAHPALLRTEKKLVIEQCGCWIMHLKTACNDPMGIRIRVPGSKVVPRIGLIKIGGENIQKKALRGIFSSEIAILKELARSCHEPNAKKKKSSKISEKNIYKPIDLAKKDEFVEKFVEAAIDGVRGEITRTVFVALIYSLHVQESTKAAKDFLVKNNVVEVESRGAQAIITLTELAQKLFLSKRNQQQ